MNNDIILHREFNEKPPATITFAHYIGLGENFDSIYENDARLLDEFLSRTAPIDTVVRLFKILAARGYLMHLDNLDELLARTETIQLENALKKQEPLIDRFNQAVAVVLERINDGESIIRINEAETALDRLRLEFIDNAKEMKNATQSIAMAKQARQARRSHEK